MSEALFEKMKWRLIDESGEGADLVTAILSDELTHAGDICIETDVIAMPNDTMLRESIDYQWTEEDFMLFMKLYMSGDGIKNSERIEINLKDNWTCEVIQIVAAARFSPIYPVLPLLDEKLINTLHLSEYDVSKMVSINTKFGFRMGVIVAIDSIEASLVMLNPWHQDDDLGIGVHELVSVERGNLLPADFARNIPQADMVWH